MGRTDSFRHVDIWLRTIDVMRFPLAVMVVIIHSRQLKINYDLPNWTNMTGDDFFTFINIFFSNVFSHVAVPCFFVISGYLFFYKNRKFTGKVYVEKLKKKIFTVLFPYLLWNFSIPLVRIVIHLVKGETLTEALTLLSDEGIKIFWDSVVWGYGRENWLGQPMLETSPILTPLWFLRDLFVVFLISPFIYALLGRFKFWALLPLFFCFISGIWPDIHGFSTISILFFSFGAYFSIHGKNIVSELKKVRFISYILYVPLLIVMVLLDGNNTRIGLYIYPFFIIVSILAILNLFVFFVENGKIGVNIKLAKATFFIYAAHATFGLEIASFILSPFIPVDSTWLLMSIRYLLIPVLTISVCLVVYELMRRVCPKLLEVMTGSR